ncbi:hypothetical protein [Agreia bicolorata]|uniref:Uncharacterized protein n=1 Tax=Agreia bicolorata TaxID=110935 RepID=A0ABR5CFC4_9MICO|nr:hypothetical protein [Agreia bicolorata]KJC64319.1 hypothetical protein TZ00_07625 [Agreia bicolorata]
MPKPIVWLVVIAVGTTAYVVGAKAGHGRYTEISETAKAFWNDPAVKKARVRAQKKTQKAAKKAVKRITK